MRGGVRGAAGGFCGVLLAAGRSTRFGSDKLIHPLPDGTPIALASARALLAAMPRVVAAVSPENAVLGWLLAAEGIEVVAPPMLDEGMGTSIAACVAATADAPGWVVALADMPFIRPSTIAAVRAALAAGSPLAAPVYRGSRGHPVGFGAKFRGALAALRGDEGARWLLHEHRDELGLVECADPGIVRDVDRPGDLPPP